MSSLWRSDPADGNRGAQLVLVPGVSAMTGAKAALVCVRGSVQGVGFRASARRRARQRGLVGWIRNNEFGEVEALVQGPAVDVDDFIAWMGGGPSAAEVTSVETTSAEPDPDLDTFDIRR